MARGLSQKYKIARWVAAARHTDIKGATRGFRSLMIVMGESSADDLVDVRKDLLETLPIYRHPVNLFFEIGVFLGHKSTAQEIGIPEYDTPGFKALRAICEQGADLQQVSIVYDELVEGYHARKSNAGLEPKERKLRLKLMTGEEDYNKTIQRGGPRAAEKAKTALAQALGISTGKRGSKLKTEHLEMYRAYVTLVRHNGISRETALEVVHRKYGRDMTQLSATRNRLFEVVNLIKEQLKDEKPILYDLGQHPDRYLKGLVGGHNE